VIRMEAPAGNVIKKQCKQCDQIFNPLCKTCADTCLKAKDGYYLTNDEYEENREYKSCKDDHNLGVGGCGICDYKADTQGQL